MISVIMCTSGFSFSLATLSFCFCVQSHLILILLPYYYWLPGHLFTAWSWSYHPLLKTSLWQESAKLIHSDRSQNSGSSGQGKWEMGAFRGAGNSLYLVLGSGYMGLYIHKHSLSCTLRLEYCTLCMLCLKLNTHTNFQWFSIMMTG